MIALSFLEPLKNTLSDFERSSNASKTRTQKSIRLNFSDNMCLSHVILLVKTECKPIQVKHQLSASIQYRNWLLSLKVSCASVLSTDGTFAISPKLLEFHQLTEKTKEFYWNPEAHQAVEQPKSLPHVVAIFSLPLNEKAIHPVY